MMQEIILIAQIRAKQDKHHELKHELTLLVEQTKTEPGCSQFDLYFSQNDPHLFVLWERFASQAEFDLHLQQSYTRRYFELTKPTLTEYTKSTKLDRV